MASEVSGYHGHLQNDFTERLLVTLHRRDCFCYGVEVYFFLLWLSVAMSGPFSLLYDL